MTTRIVELRQGILKKNDELARTLRRRFTDAGVFVVSMVSSPGDGALTSQIFQQRFNVALSRARDRMYLFRSVSGLLQALREQGVEVGEFEEI